MQEVSIMFDWTTDVFHCEGASFFFRKEENLLICVQGVSLLVQKNHISSQVLEYTVSHSPVALSRNSLKWQ